MTHADPCPADTPHLTNRTPSAKHRTSIEGASGITSPWLGASDLGAKPVHSTLAELPKMRGRKVPREPTFPKAETGWTKAIKHHGGDDKG